MNGEGHPRRLLSVGQVATLAGVGVDTVRAWDRQGLLCARRLPSGQRRYRVEEVEEFLQGRSSGTRRKDPRAVRNLPTRSEPRPPADFQVQREAPASDASTTAPSLDRRRFLEARADLEVLRAHRAAEVIERARRKEEAAEARAQEVAWLNYEAHRRLESIKAYGRSLAEQAPPDWKALVVRDLEGFVTPQQFPPGISEADARSFVGDRVARLLEPYTDELARRQEVGRRRECVRRLVDFGVRHARSETLLWSTEETEEACDEVRQVLEQSVGWRWTETDVKDLVEEILDDWDGAEQCDEDDDDIQED